MCPVDKDNLFENVKTFEAINPPTQRMAESLGNENLPIAFDAVDGHGKHKTAIRLGHERLL